MIADEFINQVTPLLQESGFRKTQATWRKDQGESIAVFQVQKSQWDNNDIYLNVGLYYNELGSEKDPAENKCHLRARVEAGNPEFVLNEALKWFRAGESLKDAKRMVAENPGQYLAVKEIRRESTT